MRRHDLTYAQQAHQTGERGRSATPVRTRVGLWCHREPPRARLCEETGASILADFVQSGTIKADACPLLLRVDIRIRIARDIRRRHSRRKEDSTHHLDPKVAQANSVRDLRVDKDVRQGSMAVWPCP